MYKPHPIFKRPKKRSTKIWRYMDFLKFISLIENRSLFFSRCDLLGDPFEGSIPSSTKQVNLTKLAQQSAANLLGISLDNVEPLIIHEHVRNSSYVCCFHMSDYESAALWSIYTKENQGVAIQSNFSRLCRCFDGYSNNSVRIGMMNYINYRTETIEVLDNVILPILHKRKSYDFEKELRAVLFFPKELYPEPKARSAESFFNDIPTGLSVPVNLNTLIEHVYISPTSEPWVRQLLESILKKNKLDIKIEQSSLADDPIF